MESESEETVSLEVTQKFDTFWFKFSIQDMDQIFLFTAHVKIISLKNSKNRFVQSSQNFVCQRGINSAKRSNDESYQILML